MKNILFVCTGNTCRSSMAEGLLKAVLASDDGLGAEYSVSSAGISAFDGDMANSNSIRVLKENWDIDISMHSAKMLTYEDIAKAFLVLAMTRGQKESIIMRFPQAREKVYTLKEYVNDHRTTVTLEDYNYALDIPDPYGMSYENYKKCGADIKEAVDKLLVRLKNKA